MKNIGLIIALISLSLFTCCKSKSEKTAAIESVEILKAFGEKSMVPVSSIADSIEYILLENSPGHIIDDADMINVVDSMIVVMHFQHIFLFNGKSGKYICEISSFGRGPEEHLRVNVYDEKNNAIIATSSNSVKEKICYFLDGRKPARFNVPEIIFENGESNHIFDFASLGAGKFLGYWDNNHGINKYKLAVFDSTGQIIKQYRNYNFFEEKDLGYGAIVFNQKGFFNCFDTLRFYEFFTDTVFSVSGSEIAPKFFLKMGKLASPYYLQTIAYQPEYGNEHTKYIEFVRFKESARFLVFSFRFDYFSYLGYYDKKTKTTVVCDETSDKEYYKYPEYYEIRCIGFYNDIDSFVPIGTGLSLNVNRRDELITFINAIDVEHWFQQNPEKAARLPEHLKKFSNVKATDNIVVQVVHLKQ